MWLFYFLLPVKWSPPHRNFRRVKWNHFYKLPVPGAWVKKCQQFFPPAKTSFFLYFYVHRAALTAEALPPALMFSSLILFEPVAVDNSPFHSWACGCSVFPAPVVGKNCPFPHCPGTLSKRIWPRLISGLSVPFHWSICLSACQYHSFDNCSFAVCFEMKECEPFSFVRRSQHYFGYL